MSRGSVSMVGTHRDGKSVLGALGGLGDNGGIRGLGGLNALGGLTEIGGNGSDGLGNNTFPKLNFNFTILTPRPDTEYEEFTNWYVFHHNLFYIYAVLAASSLALNFLLIIIFLAMRNIQKRRIPNIIFLLQAISDLFLSTFLIFSTICTKLDRDNEEHDRIYKAYLFFFEYTIYSSLNILFLASIERFLAIRCPLRHRTIVTINKVLISSMLTFIISAIPAVVYISCVKKGTREITIYFIVIAVISLTEVITIYLLLMMTYISIKKSIAERIQRQKATKRRSDDQTVQTEKRKNIRIFRIFLFMCTIYAVTLLPFISLTFYVGTLKETTYEAYVLTRSFEIVYVSSAIINPFITIVFKEDYRKVLVKFLKRHRVSRNGMRVGTI